MYNLTKTIKYSAINFNTNIKHIVVYHLKWVDSTYDATVTEKIVKLDGSKVFRDTTDHQECVNMEWLKHFLNMHKELDTNKGYYVDIKGLA